MAPKSLSDHLPARPFHAAKLAIHRIGERHTPDQHARAGHQDQTNRQNAKRIKVIFGRRHIEDEPGDPGKLPIDMKDCYGHDPADFTDQAEAADEP